MQRSLTYKQNPINNDILATLYKNANNYELRIKTDLTNGNY